MKNDVEVDAAIRNALKSMAVCGCSSCSSFDRCRNRLLAVSGGGPSLRGVSAGREKPKFGLLAKLAGLARLIFSRSHRHLVRRNLQNVELLGSIVRRMCIALLVYIACTLDVSAIVYCSWNGNGYDCSGSGEAIITTGGDGSGGSGETIIVTNIVGTCTNCVAMSPAYVAQFKRDVNVDLQILESSLGTVQSEALSLESTYVSMLEYVQGAPTPPTDTATISAAHKVRTNWIAQVAMPYGGDFVTAANSAQSNWQVLPANSIRWCGAYAGAKAYASSLPLSQTISTLDNIADSARDVQERSQGVQMSISSLSEDACTAQFNDPVGGSRPAVTNQVEGNWCTFEQGEAIKDLLGDLKEWAEKEERLLKAMSNDVVVIRQTLRSGLYSDYTAIPRQTDWQDVYLDGQPTGWGYDPTNILQRIEMLVYGISGIGTNGESDVFGEDTTPDPSTDIQDVGNSLDRFTSDASSQGTQLQRFTTALQDFFNAFSGLDGEEVSRGDIFVDESVIRLNEQEFTVPALTVSDNADLVDVASTAQQLVRLFCSVIYHVVGAVLVFVFWRMFADYVVKFTRWAQELISSLFAS